MQDSVSSLFEVKIDNYNGPLDILLDLAKAQKVNLEEISITKLADQFHDFISNNSDIFVYYVLYKRCKKKFSYK